MKIKFEPTKLLKELNCIKSTGNLTEILAHTLIIADEKIKVYYTNLSSGIIVTLDGIVIEKGSTTITTKKLSSISENSKKPINIKKEDTHIKISSGTYRSKESTYEQGDYPIMPVIDKNKVSIEVNKLMSIISRCKNTICSNDNKRNLCGLNFILNDNTIVANSSDGHRLTRYTKEIKYNGEQLNYTIPTESVGELYSICGDFKNETVDIYFDGTNLKYDFGVVKYLTRVLPDGFPDLSRIIPTIESVKHTVKLDKQSIIDAIKMLNTNIDMFTRRVRFIISKGKIVLVAVNEIGDGEYEISADSDFEMQFNVNSMFILNLLTSIEEDFFYINLIDEKSQLLVTTDEPGFIFITMPMRF